MPKGDKGELLLQPVRYISSGDMSQEHAPKKKCVGRGFSSHYDTAGIIWWGGTGRHSRRSRPHLGCAGGDNRGQFTTRRNLVTGKHCSEAGRTLHLHNVTQFLQRGLKLGNTHPSPRGVDDDVLQYKGRVVTCSHRHMISSCHKAVRGGEGAQLNLTGFLLRSSV